MDIRKIAKRYDRDPLYDALTGDYLYDGQFASYDGRQPDGSFVRRRTVSLAPELVLPPGRVVNLYFDTWILSSPIMDGFHGEPVRQTCSARRSDGLYDLCTAKELVEKTSSIRKAHAFRRFLKGTAEAAQSYLQPYHEISLSASEGFVGDLFFRLGNAVWHGSVEYVSEDGYRVVEADMVVNEDEYANAFVQVSIPGSVDPVTLEETPGLSIPGMLVERYRLFRKLDQAQPNNYHGDKTLIVAEMNPLPQIFKIDGESWTALAVENLTTGQAIHVRRV